ncbi:MAG TPA: hypothetical protein VEH79_03090 [Gaiellaceae bacterium]|jgi:hypothetical protein|nr:hypothetical protein [Gaiellaceae bacterium]
MTRSAVFGSSAIGVAALVLAASPAVMASSAPPVPKTCPPASVLKAALGQQDKAPVMTTTPYARICTYKGTGIIPTKITFQEDTTQTFAAGEKAAAAFAPVLTVKGLGKAAWGPKVGGGLYVFVGTYSIKILAPLVSTAKLEVLARKLL